ncbi:peptidoglycan DD-metalloendopeptidase family protein [Nitrosomonas sp.]|uniref:peptidoglycan DD-metalloendopeptidase family protein n=1 Tax=Nitrosomonas sp. TaxID=42353 RepID=UPI002082FE23|nr:peptidoglycan DD-metalloendopeptidase family protein [Nitrosomonas sp.]GJL74371.1 MAG: membrane protein [Nitrosomonas sp.]
MNNDQIQLKTFVGIRKTASSTFWLFVFLFLLIGCETTKGPAPVVERTVSPEKAPDVSDKKQIDQFYIIQKGDTFYSIALNHGIDQQELAEWNNITDPATIKPGQRINLSVPSKEAEPALFAVPQHTVMPVVDPALDLADGAPGSAVSSTQDFAMQKVKTYPKALKLPYSEQNVARLQYSVNPAFNKQHTDYSAATGSGTRIEDAPKPELGTEVSSDASTAEWIWPTTGKLLSAFSSNSKGVKISGQSGQSVLATAAGEVVYSGNGLRGYGNLIIIKHDDALLSAYAHNSKLLVKEGEAVVQGQKIAEMGDTDTDIPQLHFEIRRHGKPVDPLKFLPADPG